MYFKDFIFDTINHLISCEVLDIIILLSITLCLLFLVNSIMIKNFGIFCIYYHKFMQFV